MDRGSPRNEVNASSLSTGAGQAVGSRSIILNDSSSTIAATTNNCSSSATDVSPGRKKPTGVDGIPSLTNVIQKFDFPHRHDVKTRQGPHGAGGSAEREQHTDPIVAHAARVPNPRSVSAQLLQNPIQQFTARVASTGSGPSSEHPRGGTYVYSAKAMRDACVGTTSPQRSAAAGNRRHNHHRAHRLKDDDDDDDYLNDEFDAYRRVAVPSGPPVAAVSPIRDDNIRSATSDDSLRDMDDHLHDADGDAEERVERGGDAHRNGRSPTTNTPLYPRRMYAVAPTPHPLSASRQDIGQITPKSKTSSASRKPKKAASNHPDISGVFSVGGDDDATASNLSRDLILDYRRHREAAAAASSQTTTFAALSSSSKLRSQNSAVLSKSASAVHQQQQPPVMSTGKGIVAFTDHASERYPQQHQGQHKHKSRSHAKEIVPMDKFRIQSY